MNIIPHNQSLVSRQLGINVSTASKNNGGDPAEAAKPAQSEGGHQPSVRVSLSQASIEVARVNASNAVQPTQIDKPANNPFANNILNAINGQLAVDVADGATQEELQSRLEAGLSGFLSGFDEAFEQLSALSEFTGDIRGDVLSTKTQVLAGLAETAEQLGLDPSAIVQAQSDLEAQLSEHSQAAGEPETQVLNTAAPSLGAFDAFAASQNSFRFELETADGDKIEILVDSLKAAELHANGKGASGQVAQQNQFEFRVEGELDSDELKAINDLLNQVNSVSESFFSGNVEQAFEQALSMGFDSEEIQSFSLKLTQTSFSQVQSTYGADTSSPADGAARAEPSKNLVHLGNFLQELEKANILAEEMGQQLSLVTELADNISKARGLGQASITDFVARLAS